MAQNTPASANYASASLYVGDLGSEVTEAILFEQFNNVGPVASVRVCRDAATRRSLGYAYVNFHRVDDAERALDTMNFTNIRNKPCRIMWSHRDPSLRKSGKGNIFVKNLHKSIDNKQLYDTFSMFGNILSCKVATSVKGESLGYGFVHYETEESALSAIARVDGMMIADLKVEVMPFKSKEERGGFDRTRYTNVYVKNLPEDFDEDKVKELFGAYGEITSFSLPKDAEGKSKGFGFINFNTPEEASVAVAELNDKEVQDKKLYVARAQKREEREKELRERFEQMKLERQKKYAGVNLYIKNLHDEIDDDRLREEFSKFGAITSCRVMRDQAGKSKGFGFVCFSQAEEATKAVTEMNGRMLENKPLYVALHQRKEVRRAQLEVQHAARTKHMGPTMPQMYPGPQVAGGPMFYQGMPQRMVYPQQMMRGWNPAQGGPRQQMMRGQVNYQLMPMANGAPGANPQQRGGAPRQARGGPRKGAPAGQARQGQGFPAQQVMGNQPAQADAGLSPEALAAAAPEQQKQIIGERLFPLIQAKNANLAGKITGMLLEMDNFELLHLLESDEALTAKVDEALQVLEQHAQETTAPQPEKTEE